MLSGLSTGPCQSRRDRLRRGRRGIRGGARRAAPESHLSEREKSSVQSRARPVKAQPWILFPTLWKYSTRTGARPRQRTRADSEPEIEETCSSP